MSLTPIRIFNKHVTNRLFRLFARSTRGPFAVIHHVGRRSGKPYATTIMVWPLGAGFVIALTYGPDVDWLRNLMAAAHGKLLWHKRIYAVGSPEPLAVEEALPAFPRLFRPIFRRIGLRDFVYVKAAARHDVQTRSKGTPT
ncbi:MAG TPA: nitroreductase family deazaflavin-dependent oxidoreductase [Chloroflexia bacterium]|jgi:deazaflavin-dependent oxidoreductase (nitroreductase family)